MDLYVHRLCNVHTCGMSPFKDVIVIELYSSDYDRETSHLNNSRRKLVTAE